jgi:hypothetical protein
MQVAILAEKNFQWLLRKTLTLAKIVILFSIDKKDRDA